MRVETSVKVRLTEDEERILKQAQEVINDIYSATVDFESEIDFEDDVFDILNDMQSTIRNII